MSPAPPETASSGSRRLSEFITAVFTAWREAGIDFVVLRNYESLPEHVSNDIDILVAPRQIKLAEKELVAAAARAGFVLHNRVEFLPISLYFFHEMSLQQIQVDLFQSLKWRGFHFISPAPILDSRIQKDLFAIQHPAHEAVNSLMTRLIYHGYVKEDYKPTIHRIAKDYPSELASTLRGMFGGKLADCLINAIHEEEWKTVEAQTGRLRWALAWRQLTRHPLRTAGSMLGDLKRLAFRLLRPPGMTVVILGTDGSGKSTAATNLTEALRHTFYPNKVLRIHWKPTVFLRRRRAERPPTRNPHAATPRNALSTYLALLYHWIEYFLGALLYFLPVRFRNGLVLVDRYHYDFAVDPKRYRINPPGGFVRALYRLIPTPDLIFLLDAPSEVLRSRKQEVSPEETSRQREAYLNLVSGMSNGRIIDSNQPTEAVTRELARNVLEFLKRKQSVRSTRDIHGPTGSNEKRMTS